MATIDYHGVSKRSAVFNMLPVLSNQNASHLGVGQPGPGWRLSPISILEGPQSSMDLLRAYTAESTLIMCVRFPC